VTRLSENSVIQRVMTSHRFTREGSALLVIDVQERLAAAMNPERFARVLNRTLAAIAGAKALGLPIVYTEQYPKGLGPTMQAVKTALGDLAGVEKTEFSALLPAVKQQLTARPNVLVTGMETHVCVFQTVRDLAAQGFTPYLAADAVLSRDPVDHQNGIELCKQAGALVTTVETALFDALGKAGGPEFKAVSTAVK
jgi:nicotinamidase-related amidase